MTEPFLETVWRAVNPSTLTVFAILLLIAVAIGGTIVGLLFVARAIDRHQLRQFFVLLLALALFGGIAGYAGGLSREAAVGQIIPAVLGLAGGLAAYLFGVDTSRGVVASVALVAFTVALFFGYTFGSDVRGDNDINAAFRDACFKLFYDPETYDSDEKMMRALGAENQRLKDCILYWTAIP